MCYYLLYPFFVHLFVCFSTDDDNDDAASVTGSVTTLAEGAEAMRRNDIEVLFIASATDKAYKKARFEVEEARHQGISRRCEQEKMKVEKVKKEEKRN